MSKSAIKPVWIHAENRVGGRTENCVWHQVWRRAEVPIMERILRIVWNRVKETSEAKPQEAHD